jgi:hypothetical protein
VLTLENDGWYHSPRPLAGGGLVVSFLPRDGSGGYRLVRVDPETGKRIGREIVADGFHLIDAQELTSRPRVRGRSSVVKMAADTGVFFCISSHLSNPFAGDRGGSAGPGIDTVFTAAATGPRRAPDRG